MVERMMDKVRCKICGKVGCKNQVKALHRHLKICHGILTKEPLEEHFVPTDEDVLIEISLSKTEIKKSKKLKRKVRNSKEELLHSSYTRIIYTPMGNKR